MEFIAEKDRFEDIATALPPRDVAEELVAEAKRELAVAEAVLALVNAIDK